MSIPNGYSYKGDPVCGGGYWKDDGTGPYRFTGTTMKLIAVTKMSQVGLTATAPLQGQFWDSDDASGPLTIR